jgi:hypothetical protein
MKKYQKTAIAGISAMTMLLTPMGAFAHESAPAASSPPAQEVQAGNFAALATISGVVGNPTTDIYLNGSVTIGVNAPNGGNFVVYAIQNGSYNYLGEIIGTGSITRKLYGYNKIYVSSSFAGTFYVNY